MNIIRKILHNIIAAPRVVIRFAYTAPLMLAIAVLAGFTVFFWPGVEDVEDNQQKQISSSVDGFVVRANYEGNQNWNFKVDGNFSNQCINSDVAVEQLEGDPEKVTVRLVAYRPTDETLCAQKIQEVSHNGTFEASRDASIALKIDERESKESPTGLKLKNI